jgi:hypothetical protein
VTAGGCVGTGGSTCSAPRVGPRRLRPVSPRTTAASETLPGNNVTARPPRRTTSPSSSAGIQYEPAGTTSTGSADYDHEHRNNHRKHGAAGSRSGVVVPGVSPRWTRREFERRTHRERQCHCPDDARIRTRR